MVAKSCVWLPSIKIIIPFEPILKYRIMEHPENDQQYAGLAVNKGIQQPPSVNPYMKVHRRRRLLSAAEYVEGILRGDVTILSQAVTLVESHNPDHEAIAQEVIEKFLVQVKVRVSMCLAFTC